MKRMKPILLILTFFLLGCSHTLETRKAAPAGGHRYTSDFTLKDASGLLETASRSVGKLIVAASYKTYRFAPSEHVKQLFLDTLRLQERTEGVSLSHETVSGTATLLSRTNGKYILVTSAHILDFPDTLITFSDPSRTFSTDEIAAISLRQKLEIYCREMPGCGSLHILAADKTEDVAFVGAECVSDSGKLVPLDFQPGEARDLGWGSAAYIIGFPMGLRMVTRGIVSNLQNDTTGAFLLDAPFNKGFSGGLILAQPATGNRFEWVGLIRSAGSKREYVLRPEKEIYEYPYNPRSSYKGELRVGIDENINYGVTQAVPVDAVKKLYSFNRSLLLQAGYNLDRLFFSDKRK